MVFLENISKAVLFLHFIGVILFGGSIAHNLVIVYGYTKGRFARERSEKLFLKISFWSYLLVFIAGILIYPTYGVRVKLEYFTETMPWANALFEIKEHWAAIGLVLFGTTHYLRGHFSPKENKNFLFFYIPATGLLFIISVYLIWSGFYLTTLKSI